LNPFLSILFLIAPILLAGGIALKIKINQINLRLLLAFSAAYLFALSIIHLLPEAFELGNVKQMGLFIVLGFCLQLLIDTFSTGIEHGHVHLHSSECKKHLPNGIIIGLRSEPYQTLRNSKSHWGNQKKRYYSPKNYQRTNII
jgi:hypothetical protein